MQLRNKNSTMATKAKDGLSSFPATFPTKLYCSKTERTPKLRVFWTQTQTNSSSGGKFTFFTFFFFGETYTTITQLDLNPQPLG